MHGKHDARPHGTPVAHAGDGVAGRNFFVNGNFDTIEFFHDHCGRIQLQVETMVACVDAGLLRTMGNDCADDGMSRHL